MMPSVCLKMPELMQSARATCCRHSRNAMQPQVSLQKPRSKVSIWTKHASLANEPRVVNQQHFCYVTVSPAETRNDENAMTYTLADLTQLTRQLQAVEQGAGALPAFCKPSSRDKITFSLPRCDDFLDSFSPASTLSDDALHTQDRACSNPGELSGVGHSQSSMPQNESIARSLCSQRQCEHQPKNKRRHPSAAYDNIAARASPKFFHQGTFAHNSTGNGNMLSASLPLLRPKELRQILNPQPSGRLSKRLHSSKQRTKKGYSRVQKLPSVTGTESKTSASIHLPPAPFRKTESTRQAEKSMAARSQKLKRDRLFANRQNITSTLQVLMHEIYLLMDLNCNQVGNALESTKAMIPPKFLFELELVKHAKLAFSRHPRTSHLMIHAPTIVRIIARMRHRFLFIGMQLWKVHTARHKRYERVAAFGVLARAVSRYINSFRERKAEEERVRLEHEETFVCMIFITGLLNFLLDDDEKKLKRGNDWWKNFGCKS